MTKIILLTFILYVYAYYAHFIYLRWDVYTCCLHVLPACNSLSLSISLSIYVGVRGSPEWDISSLGALAVGLPEAKSFSRHVAADLGRARARPGPVQAWPGPGPDPSPGPAWPRPGPGLSEHQIFLKTSNTLVWGGGTPTRTRPHTNHKENSGRHGVGTG